MPALFLKISVEVLEQGIGTLFDKCRIWRVRFCILTCVCFHYKLYFVVMDLPFFPLILNRCCGLWLLLLAIEISPK